MKTVRYSLMFLIPILFIAFITVMVFGSIQRNDLENRFKDILKEYDSRESVRMKELESESVIRAYDLKHSSYMFLVSTQGYEDQILLAVELDGDRIKAVEVLFHDETEDYGTYVVENWYLKRLMIPYDGPLKSVRFRKNSPEEVIAITGATITSDAVVAGVNLCVQKMEGYE